MSSPLGCSGKWSVPWLSQLSQLSQCRTVAVQNSSSNDMWTKLFFGTWQKFKGCRIVFGFFVASGFGFFFGFLSRYHLPCICNSLELEPVILHGICYIWPCSPSILHGIFHILAFQPLICMVFATFVASNVHVGLLRVLYHLGFL